MINQPTSKPPHLDSAEHRAGDVAWGTGAKADRGHVRQYTYGVWPRLNKTLLFTTMSFAKYTGKTQILEKHDDDVVICGAYLSLIHI